MKKLFLAITLFSVLATSTPTASAFEVSNSTKIIGGSVVAIAGGLGAWFCHKKEQECKNATFNKETEKEQKLYKILKFVCAGATVAGTGVALYGSWKAFKGHETEFKTGKKYVVYLGNKRVSLIKNENGTFNINIQEPNFFGQWEISYNEQNIPQEKIDELLQTSITKLRNKPFEEEELKALNLFEKLSNNSKAKLNQEEKKSLEEMQSLPIGLEPSDTEQLKKYLVEYILQTPAAKLNISIIKTIQQLQQDHNKLSVEDKLLLITDSLN